MENKEIRRLNLQILVDQHKTIAALADHTGIAAAYLSQILNKSPSSNNTPRGMGNATSRKIEEKCGKPNGWMDSLHDETGGEYIYIKNPLLLSLLRAAEKAPPEVVADHTRGIDTTTQLIDQAKEAKK